MEPGIYIFADDDFKIGGGAQLAGQEVLLAYTNSKFWMTGGAVMKVTSPRSVGPVHEHAIHGGRRVPERQSLGIDRRRLDPGV